MPWVHKTTERLGPCQPCMRQTPIHPSAPHETLSITGGDLNSKEQMWSPNQKKLNRANQNFVVLWFFHSYPSNSFKKVIIYLFPSTASKTHVKRFSLKSREVKCSI